jgi:hypothetical protein
LHRVVFLRRSERFVKPTTAAALAAAVLAVLALGGGLRRSISPPPKAASSRAASDAECPSGTLPDEGVCVPVPRVAPPASHPERGTLRADRIPRRADRPPEIDGYVLPFAVLPTGGSPATPTEGDGGLGSAALRFRVAPNTAVSAVRLEGQEGPTELLCEGRLIGTTLVTHHVVPRGTERLEILLVVGALDQIRPLPPRTEVAEGERLGTAGHAPVALEARVVRRGVDPWALAPEQLFDDALTISEDARNVLSRR